MKMVDLKLSKEKSKSEVLHSPMKVDGSEYPYGTRLNLDTDQITALGLEKCEAGETVMVHAVGKVIETGTNSRAGDKKTQRMEIQLQRMNVMKDDGKEYREGFAMGSKRKE